jgi:hypothetical protein
MASSSANIMPTLLGCIQSERDAGGKPHLPQHTNIVDQGKSAGPGAGPKSKGGKIDRGVGGALSGVSQAFPGFFQGEKGIFGAKRREERKGSPADAGQKKQWTLLSTGLLRRLRTSLVWIIAIIGIARTGVLDLPCKTTSSSGEPAAQTK